MPLLGVTATPRFFDIPPHRITFLLPHIPEIDYRYPFTGPPTNSIDQVVRDNMTCMHDIIF